MTRSFSSPCCAISSICFCMRFLTSSTSSLALLASALYLSLTPIKSLRKESAPPGAEAALATPSWRSSRSISSDRSQRSVSWALTRSSSTRTRARRAFRTSTSAQSRNSSVSCLTLPCAFSSLPLRIAFSSSRRLASASRRSTWRVRRFTKVSVVGLVLDPPCEFNEICESTGVTHTGDLPRLSAVPCPVTALPWCVCTRGDCRLAGWVSEPATLLCHGEALADGPPDDTEDCGVGCRLPGAGSGPISAGGGAEGPAARAAAATAATAARVSGD